MDKKNTTIGVLLLVAAMASFYFSARYAPRPPAPLPVAPAPAEHAVTPAAAVPGAISSAPATVISGDSVAEVTTLANDFIEVRFTAAGGAIRDVALKKYPATIGSTAPFVFNAVHSDPLLALVEYPGLDRQARYERVSVTDSSIVYRAVLDGRLEVTRRYTLAPSTGATTDPYQLRHETTFRNLTAQPFAALPIRLAIGTTAPGSSLDLGQYTTTGYLVKDGSTSFTARSSLDVSGGFMGLGAHDARPPVTHTGTYAWVTVKDQFFVSLLTPDSPATALITSRIKMRESLPGENPNANYGLAGTAQFQLPALAAHAEAKLDSDLYVGPKEYTRLSKVAAFKSDQDRVLDFGFFGWASKILITLMTKIHSLLPDVRWNWAASIILTTLSLKLVFLWPTFSAARSMRRMAKLQPQMQAIREKFKDNPQKQSAAQMELWKEHKVNPIGGCLPMLLPLPFFIGFFSMLQHTAELRFAPFLWASDLSATDTVGHVFGIAINVLPLLFTATTFIQMRLTPTPNADPAQARMMQFMPLIFLFIYYNFSCALSLYSMTNALFTIGQQMIINRLKDDGDPANMKKAGATGGMKNVTPKKKK